MQCDLPSPSWELNSIGGPTDCSGVSTSSSLTSCDDSQLFTSALSMGTCSSCYDAVGGDSVSPMLGFICINGSVARCPPGNYCPLNHTDRSIAMFPCSNGEVCLEGFITPTKCHSAFQKCNGTEVTETPLLGIVLAFLIIFIIVISVSLIFHRRRMVNQALHKRHAVVDGATLGEAFASDTPSCAPARSNPSPHPSSPARAPWPHARPSAPAQPRTRARRGRAA